MTSRESIDYTIKWFWVPGTGTISGNNIPPPLPITQPIPCIIPASIDPPVLGNMPPYFTYPMPPLDGTCCSSEKDVIIGVDMPTEVEEKPKKEETWRDRPSML